MSENTPWLSVGCRANCRGYMGIYGIIIIIIGYLQGLYSDTYIYIYIYRLKAQIRDSGFWDASSATCKCDLGS